METLQKRTWYYVGKPCQDYGIPPCACGNDNIVYSEYQDRLWCDKCQIDYEPEYWGIFDGPICVEVCELFGITFDRINLETNQYERAVHTDNPDCCIEYVPVHPVSSRPAEEGD